MYAKKLTEVMERLVLNHSIQFDSFFSLMYPQDPSIWKEHLCPVGEIEKYVESDNQGPLAPWLTDEVSLLASNRFG